jgi:voltage-gated potassium channel
MSAKIVLLKVIGISICILTIVLCGSFIYADIENMTFFDALYMTVITLSTTGYGDLVPKTVEGKAFTMVLLLMGVGVVTYSISTILSYITSIDFTQRRRIKMEKRVAKLEGHTIVCGFGRMGEIICKRLKEQKIDFVVIEKRDNLIEKLNEAGHEYIVGDAAHDDMLMKAGVEKAKVLVSVIDNDSDGLYIALAGRSFNKNLYIIVRANEKSAEKRMIRAGADKVVLPIVMSGLNVAESVINPAVEDLFNIKGMTSGKGEEVPIQLADLYIPKESSLINKRLEEVGPAMQELIIVGIRKANQDFIFNPRGDYSFSEGDCIIALGKQDSYLKTKEFFHLNNNR